MCVNFQGVLDGSGCSQALLVSGRIRPEFVGAAMHFAFFLENPMDFVSNPVKVMITP